MILKSDLQGMSQSEPTTLRSLRERAARRVCRVEIIGEMHVGDWNSPKSETTGQKLDRLRAYSQLTDATMPGWHFQRSLLGSNHISGGECWPIVQAFGSHLGPTSATISEQLVNTLRRAQSARVG